MGEEEDEDEKQKLKLFNEEIALNLFKLFLLTIDSSSMTLEWALAYLVTYSHIEERAY